MERNQKQFSRGRKLVAMSLEKEMCPVTDGRRLGNSSLAPSLTYKRENVSSGNISTSELTNFEELQIELPPISDSFFSIYQETQKLLLDIDPFRDDFNFQRYKEKTTCIQEADDNSFIEDSDEEVSYFDMQRPTKITKISDIFLSSIETINIAKPSITVSETPEHSHEDFSQDSIMSETASVTFIREKNVSITKPPITIPETPEHSLEDFSPDKSMETIQQLPKPSTSTAAQDSVMSEIASVTFIREKTLKNASKEYKMNNYRNKHPIGDHCGYKCKQNCEKFSLEEREQIWNSYWNLLHDNQLKWAARFIQLKGVNSRSHVGNKKYKRHETRDFFLPHMNGVSEKVCRRFFLNTLGYKNDSIVTTISKKLNSNPTHIVSDKRGTNPKPKVDVTKIKEFINLYNPCTAHYRRHNSPNMRYLSQDITLNKLFQDFKNCFPTFVCSNEVFRKTLKEMNISLRRPQNDKCFDCLNFEFNIKNAFKSSNVPSLTLFCKKVLHKVKVEKATQAYKEDSLKDVTDTKFLSMDLQKTVLLPMIPDVKDCFFTNRLVGLNLTFCGLKKNSKEGSKCIVWHEATGGRDGKDMVDAIYKFLASERDTKNFVLWADNCTAQNKNWILFTALVIIVNVHDIDSITIRYLTKGHTHMSADGVHGNIEQYFKKTKNVYDFTDYKQCIEKSRKNNDVIEIQLEDKYNWEKKKKASSEELKKFLLKDIVEVKFVKNQKTLLYKKSFDEKDYGVLDFIQKRFKFNQLPKNVTKLRGIRSSKKNEILSKLVPIMPVNRRSFWHELPQSDNAGDLIRDEEILIHKKLRL